MPKKIAEILPKGITEILAVIGGGAALFYGVALIIEISRSRLIGLPAFYSFDYAKIVGEFLVDFTAFTIPIIAITIMIGALCLIIGWIYIAIIAILKLLPTVPLKSFSKNLQVRDTTVRLK